ncbi:MAG: AarF/UbiB family protein [Vampirovibrionales bacterium]
MIYTYTSATTMPSLPNGVPAPWPIPQTTLTPLPASPLAGPTQDTLQRQASPIAPPPLQTTPKKPWSPWVSVPLTVLGGTAALATAAVALPVGYLMLKPAFSKQTAWSDLQALAGKELTQADIPASFATIRLGAADVLKQLGHNPEWYQQWLEKPWVKEGSGVTKAALWLASRANVLGTVGWQVFDTVASFPTQSKVDMLKYMLQPSFFKQAATDIGSAFAYLDELPTKGELPPLPELAVVRDLIQRAGIPFVKATQLAALTLQQTGRTLGQISSELIEARTQGNKEVVEGLLTEYALHKLCIPMLGEAPQTPFKEMLPILKKGIAELNATVYKRDPLLLESITSNEQCIGSASTAMVYLAKHQSGKSRVVKALRPSANQAWVAQYMESLDRIFQQVVGMEGNEKARLMAFKMALEQSLNLGQQLDTKVEKQASDFLSGVIERYQLPIHVAKVDAVTDKLITQDPAEGQTLKSILSSDVVSQAEKHEAVLAVKKAWATASLSPFRHLDLHPSNVFYDPATKKVTLIDLGMAGGFDEASSALKHYYRLLESVALNREATPVDVRVLGDRVDATQQNALVTGLTQEGGLLREQLLTQAKQWLRPLTTEERQQLPWHRRVVERTLKAIGRQALNTKIGEAMGVSFVRKATTWSMPSLSSTAEQRRLLQQLLSPTATLPQAELATLLERMTLNPYSGLDTLRMAGNPLGEISVLKESTDNGLVGNLVQGISGLASSTQRRLEDLNPLELKALSRELNEDFASLSREKQEALWANYQKASLDKLDFEKKEKEQFSKILEAMTFWLKPEYRMSEASWGNTGQQGLSPISVLDGLKRAEGILNLTHEATPTNLETLQRAVKQELPELPRKGLQAIGYKKHLHGKRQALLQQKLEAIYQQFSQEAEQQVRLLEQILGKQYAPQERSQLEAFFKQRMAIVTGAIRDPKLDDRAYIAKSLELQNLGNV